MFETIRLVTNIATGETRYIKVPSIDTLERAMSDGIDRCVGPCRCTIEPDGECPNGWPSRLRAMGMI